MKIGILTSGGDCPGLNAVMRGFARYAEKNLRNAELIGIRDGYRGLMDADTVPFGEFSCPSMLSRGGTVLGTSRQPWRLMAEDDGARISLMKRRYRELGLDALLVLGGAGTHRTLSMLSSEGLNVIGLPKTIDNDIWGTDITFGFSTAAGTGAGCLEMLRTTASSHGRTMIVEIMGNKTGWLTLASGLAGGADMILIPEIPFSEEKVAREVERRASVGHGFTLIAVAEGAVTREEKDMKKAERILQRGGRRTVTERLSSYISGETGIETRTSVPGHILRGGSPNAFDRVISTAMGKYAGELLREGLFGTTVALRGGAFTWTKLSEMAGKIKYVGEDSVMLSTARKTGVFLGE